MKAFQACPSQLGIALTLAYEEAGSRVCSDRKAWTGLSHTLGMLGGSLESVAIKAVSILNARRSWHIVQE